MVIRKIHRKLRVFFAHSLSAAMCLVVSSVFFGQPGGRPAAALQSASNETGRYFALVIGIDKYPSPIPQLHTAVSDARAVADVLERQYGFQTTLLTDADATRKRILDQLAAYQSQLAPEDNLLIYYAGHGFRIEEANKSFWLPVDAISRLSSNRISADDLTTDIATLKARHVLIISDSCYSGGLTRDLNTYSDIKPDDAFLRKTLTMRSRSLMASGRDEPVADGGPDGHSVFAWAVLQALKQQTDGVFTASELFYKRVQRAVAGNSEQIPVYQPLRNSGDIGGDFVFRRATAARTEVAARLTAVASGFYRGEALYNAGDYARAAPVFSESCGQRDPRSCTKLGYMYAHGRGVTQDYAQAVALYRKGCNGGNALSCSNLGFMYGTGHGVTQDNAQELALYRKGCDGGYMFGCTNLGVMYANGEGVMQDYALAIGFYRKSCDGGDALGCTDLGVTYENGHGVTQDYAQAVALYRKGCDGGNANGCTKLGLMYETGHGVTQDYAQAVALYRKGCDGGDANGCTNLGFMYATGRGLTQDYAQAVALYRKGCDGGNARGCSNLQSLQKPQGQYHR